jgi:DNA modification methylase
MTVDIRDQLASPQSLRSQLKGKSRRRRQSLARLAEAVVPLRATRNDPLPLLELVAIPLDELRVSARKLRGRDPAHVREVAEAIGALGFCVPLLIGKGNIVIDGNIRLEAAKQASLDRVPCIRIDHLSEIQQRTLKLAVNRLAEKGQWDLDELKIEFEELILAEAPIEITGFSEPEIDHIILGTEDEAIEEGPLAPDGEAAPIAHLGDLFQLGLHRLICGDATDPEILARLMDGDAAVRLVFTDEPYNVLVVGHVTGGRHREFKMASGEMTGEEYLAFNEAWMGAAHSYLCDGGVLGTFIDWRGYPTVIAAAAKLDLSPLNLVVWAKTNAGMGSLYRSQHELLPLYRKGAGANVNNVELGKKGRWRSNVWTYPGASSLGSDARRGLKDHPTVKPMAMIEDALLDLTRRGDIVLDPFLGSGSTLIAAERAGRICRGVEIDPLYADVIVRRYEAMTKKAVVLVSTGETFAELAARRMSGAAVADQPLATAAEVMEMSAASVEVS